VNGELPHGARTVQDVGVCVIVGQVRELWVHSP